MLILKYFKGFEISKSDEIHENYSSKLLRLLSISLTWNIGSKKLNQIYIILFATD